MTHTFRLAYAVGLSASLLAGCDSNGAEDDLYRLDPIRFDSYFEIPEGGSATTTLPLTIPVTISVEAEAFQAGQMVEVTAAGSQTLTEALTAAGYTWAAFRGDAVSASGTLVLDEPAGATFDLFQVLRLDVEAGNQRSQVLDMWYPYGGRFDLSLYFQQEWVSSLREQPLRARLALQPREDQQLPTSGTYTFELQMQFFLEVGTAAPAPDGLVLTRDFHVRNELRYRGVDVADVEEAWIEEVVLTAHPFYNTASTSTFTERFRGIDIRVALPGEDGEVVGRIERFERNPATGVVTGVADVRKDVTALVRRSSELEFEIEMDLNEAAASRGEYYPFSLTTEMIMEVPVDALESESP